MQDQAIWYPYAQMKRLAPAVPVVRAEGVFLELADGRRLIDAVSSWWTVIHGYNHPELNAALCEQLERFAHVMLGGLTHQPAAMLAQELAELTGLEHVFFSDSGSVGVEVALKMAVQFWQNRGQAQKRRFAALRGAYHGDTTGAMSVCDPVDSMHASFGGLLQEQLFLPRPAQQTLDADIAAMQSLLAQRAGELAGVVIEPLLQAAGGFYVYPAKYVKALRQVCDENDLLLICDEVATGFGRTGRWFAVEHSGILPDIMVLGKGLTGGYCGHAATLANEPVYQGFYDDAWEKAFMHGPTFMGNALACAVAMKSIEIFERENYLAKVARIEQILKEQLLPIRELGVTATRVLGAMGVVEVEDPSVYSGLQEFALERGVWLRPFGHWIYTMPPYIITERQLEQIVNVIREWFTQHR